MTAAERAFFAGLLLIQFSSLAAVVHFRRQDRRVGCCPSCVGGAK